MQEAMRARPPGERRPRPWSKALSDQGSSSVSIKNGQVVLNLGPGGSRCERPAIARHRSQGSPAWRVARLRRGLR